MTLKSLRDSPLKAILLLTPLLLTIFSKWTRAWPISSQRKPDYKSVLNLNEWLSDYHDCFISILTQAPNLDLGPFPFPIHLMDVLPIDNQFKEFLRPVDYRKHGRCDITTLVLSEVKGFDKYTLLDTWEQFFPRDNKFFLVNHGTFKYWPDIFILAGLEESAWPFLYAKYPSLIADYKKSHVDTQLFVLFGVVVQAVQRQWQIQLTQMTYFCRFCTYTSPYHDLIPVNRSRLEGSYCRGAMDATIQEVTHGGKTVIAIYSYRTTGLRYINEAKSKVTRDFFLNLSPMDFLHYNQDVIQSRGTTSEYVTIILAILFQNVPDDLADTLEEVTYKEIWHSESLHAITLGPVEALHTEHINILMFQMTSFNFITCDGLKGSPDLEMYHEPFQVLVWYHMVVTIIVLASILTLATRTLSSYKRGQRRNIFISFNFYVVSNILDNNFGVWGQGQNKRSLINIFKIVAASLALLSIIMGNSYKGILTSKIILPMPITIPWSKVDQLRGFDLLTLTHGEPDLGLFLYEKIPPAEYKYYSSFGEELETRMKWLIYYDEPQSRMEYFGGLLNRTTGLLSKEEVFGHLATCSKVAFIGTQAQINYMMGVNAGGTFGEGKDEFLPYCNFWQIPQSLGSYMSSRFHDLISSGIPGFWSRLESHVFRHDVEGGLGNDSSGRRAGQKLASNILAVFELTGFLIGVSIIVFWIEVGVKNLCCSFRASVLGRS